MDDKINAIEEHIRAMTQIRAAIKYYENHLISAIPGIAVKMDWLPSSAVPGYMDFKILLQSHVSANFNKLVEEMLTEFESDLEDHVASMRLLISELVKEKGK